MLEKRKILLLEKQNQMLQSKIKVLEEELNKYTKLEQTMLDAKAKYLECIKECKEATASARNTKNELENTLKLLKDYYRR